MEIRNYSPEFEEGWLRCRVLAYLHTSMYEDVVTSKPAFDGRPAIELVAVHPDHQSKGIGKKLYDEAVRRLAGTDIEFIELYTRGDEQANNFYRKLGFEMRLETYDVFGIEKGIRQPVSVEGIENGRLKVSDKEGNPCDYILTDGVYQVFTEEALEHFDWERCYPARGYYKALNEAKA